MKNIVVALVACVGLICTSQAFAQDEVVKKKLSTKVEDSVKKLEQGIKAKGLEIYAKFDHKEKAKDADVDMDSAVVVFFGDPAFNAELMNADMAWSSELPCSIAVYEDANGVVWAETTLLSDDIPTPGKEKTIGAMNVVLTELVEID